MAVSPFFSLQQSVLRPNPAGKRGNNFMAGFAMTLPRLKKNLNVNVSAGSQYQSLDLHCSRIQKKGTVTQREIATIRMSICSTICAKISLLQLRLDELGVHLLFAVCFPDCVNHLCFLSGHWSRQG